MSTLRIDVHELAAMSDALGRLSGELLRQAATESVNTVAERSDATAQANIAERINLDPGYLKSKLRLVRAVQGDTPRAEIIASDDLTILGNYGPVQQRVAGSPRRAGPTVGRRPSGVSLEVRRGAQQFEPQWFTMRLKGSGKVGVFVRMSAAGGAPVHLYGPSPYSLLRQQGQYHGDEFLDDLEQTMVAAVVKAEAVGGL